MKIGSFEARKLLGEGAFGRTYKGRHVVLGKDFPVCIKEEKTGQEPYISMFREEARMLAKLRHFGLPTLLDYQENVPGCGNLMVLTFSEGDTLGRDIQVNGPLTDEHLFWVADRICHPVEYLHEKWGIIHSDLKPDNCLIHYPGHEVTVVDLGLALQDPQAWMTAKGGTDGYFPPELQQGYPPIPQSDIYSLGKILIFLATGKDEMVARGECPADMDLRLARYIGRMIKHDPRQRPESFAIVREELHQMRQAIFGRTTCVTMVERRSKR